MNQADLFAPSVESQVSEIPECDLCALRAHLISAGTWQTRAQLHQALGWSERYIREVAEALGAEVVRCQKGFLLFEQLTREDLTAAAQACDAFESQAKKNLAYSAALRKRIHALVG